MRLNADFTERVIIRPEARAWVPSLSTAPDREATFSSATGPEPAAGPAATASTGTTCTLRAPASPESSE